MREIRIILLALIVAFSLPGKAQTQDTLLFMSGKVVPCSIIDDLGIDIRYEIRKKNDKVKEYNIHRSEIFSITKAGYEESILYVQDKELGDWLTVEEMEVFIAGEQDADRNYNVKPTFWVGFGLGAAGSYASQGGLFTTFATPLAYTTFQLAPNIRIRENTMRSLSYQYNEVYALGYERVARPKRLISALKGSAMGMVAGYLLYLIAPLE